MSGKGGVGKSTVTALIAKKLNKMGYDSRALYNIKICAVGAETARHIKTRGINPDIVPKKYIAEELYEELKDIIEEETKFDKDTVLPLVPERHQIKLNEHDTVYATGYRRTRHGEQQLELRFDGIAGCLRTPEGGSSKQYLVVKKNDEIHARLLTVREAARLMGAPDSFILPGSYNDGYKAMGDAVAMPVAQFIGENFLTKLAEAVYDD